MVLDVVEVWGCFERHPCLEAVKRAVMGSYNMSDSEYERWEFETRTGYDFMDTEGAAAGAVSLKRHAMCYIFQEEVSFDKAWIFLIVGIYCLLEFG